MSVVPTDSAVVAFRKKHGFNGCTYEGSIFRDQGVVACREGHEIEFFKDSKNAHAWIMHIYGGNNPFDTMEKYGITLKNLRDYKPSPGDAVWVDCRTEENKDRQIYESGWAIVDRRHPADSPDEKIIICFNPMTPFRRDDVFDLSGGPFFSVTPEAFQLVGFRDQWFWRWHDGFAGAHKAGNYRMMRPMWICTPPKRTDL